MIAEDGKCLEGGLIVLEELTITKPYGWIFFYNSKRFMEKNDIMHAIAGNGPSSSSQQQERQSH